MNSLPVSLTLLNCEETLDDDEYFNEDDDDQLRST